MAKSNILVQFSVLIWTEIPPGTEIDNNNVIKYNNPGYYKNIEFHLWPFSLMTFESGQAAKLKLSSLIRLVHQTFIVKTYKNN